MAISSSLRYVVSQHQQQQQSNFLTGQARTAHTFPLSSETIFVQSTEPTPTSHECKLGCHLILSNLKLVFNVLGRHPAKSNQKRHGMARKELREHARVDVCMRTCACALNCVPRHRHISTSVVSLDNIKNVLTSKENRGYP